jgi:hypothetical protein
VALVATAAVSTVSAGASRPGAVTATTPRTSAPADHHVARRVVSNRVSAALGPAGELRGMALNDVGVPSRLVLGTIADFPRMAQEGITSVAVYLYLYLPSPAGTTLATGAYTPTDAELQVIATAAKAAGLGVQFMPVLLDNATNGWRGEYIPSDIPAFFANYTVQVVHYADLAQSLGVTLFFVGSENRQLEPQTAAWRTLIATTRRHYSGALSYMAIPKDAAKIKFWNSLDLAAISPYFSMGDDKTPTYDRDVIAWKQAHLPYVASLVKTIKMPLIYGETGYSSQAGTFTHPNLSPLLGNPAPAAQADAYRAALDMLAITPGVYGVTWWRWQVGGGPADIGFSPAGKPAECVLASHWSPDANVRTLAAQPTCDLHTLDALASLAPLPSVGR